MLTYLLLLLIPVVAVIYVVWNHRRRAAACKASSAERMHGLVGAGSATARPADATSDNLGSSAPVVSYVRRDRVLSPPQTLLYYLLRSGMPDHVVFAQLTLASVLDTAPGVADHARAEMARRLADHQFDFIITDKRMRPVVVIKLTSASDAAQHLLSSTQRWLTEAGVRYVELDSAALPRKEAIRSAVLGEPEPADGGNADTALTA
jgi:Protein of unknown function (DUF2726)